MDVQIRCICPGTPHEGDTVTLQDTLDFRKTLTVRQHLAHGSVAEMTLPEMMALLGEAYLMYCISSWTLVDADGKPLSVSKAAITSILMAPEHLDVAETIGNAADGLYSDKVFLPLRKGASPSSPATPTGRSTSATSGHGSTPRKPSKRSSTSTSPMAVTGPMAASPGGASSSWQS